MCVCVCARVCVRVFVCVCMFVSASARIFVIQDASQSPPVPTIWPVVSTRVVFWQLLSFGAGFSFAVIPLLVFFVTWPMEAVRHGLVELLVQI